MLTPEELTIKSYTNGLFVDLNGDILKNKITNEGIKIEKLINNGLDKLPSYKEITYRGMRIKEDKALDYLQTLKNSNEFTFNTFTSTSISERTAINFAERKDGIVYFEIRGKNGKNITHLSTNPGEEEVLFKSKSKFKYIDSIITRGKTYAHSEERLQRVKIIIQEL